MDPTHTSRVRKAVPSLRTRARPTSHPSMTVSSRMVPPIRGPRPSTVSVDRELLPCASHTLSLPHYSPSPLCPSAPRLAASTPSPYLFCLPILSASTHLLCLPILSASSSSLRLPILSTSRSSRHPLSSRLPNPSYPRHFCYTSPTAFIRC